ncbi:MAG: heavy metal translocating P-type ATPase [Eubacteriales bacterium]|nr:heavy metal translocating P-type ATPase [Eubacteriales bacterium]
MKKVYLLEELCCANCGAKIERAVNELPSVEEATLVFPTKQLRVTATNADGLREDIERIARGIESDIHVVDRDAMTPVKKVYLLEELCCANCGAKIEREVSELSNVVEATLIFPTKQLRVTTTDPFGLREEIEEIARSYESDIHVTDRDGAPEEPVVPEHEHHPHDECSCGHEQHEHSHEHEKTPKKPGWIAEHKELTQIICGAVLFAAGLLLEHLGDLFLPSLVCYILAYIILGHKVVIEAVRHLFTGLVFDESFLMTVATLGAFAIQEFPEAVGVMLFFQIGEYFEDVAVEKSRSQIMEAVDLRPEVVTKEIGDKTRVIPAVNALVGDILIVRPGDRIPLDGTVLSGESYLDTSAITGEPVPVRVAAGDELTSGCVNTDGVLRMRVDRPLSESMVTRILDSVENAAASKPKIDRFITRFARVYTPFVVALAAAVAILPSLFTGNWHYWVYTALTFLVISCPCALVLSVPLAFFSGIGTGSRKGILFKGGISLEALSGVKAAVMDKTGTLTHGTFTVTSIEPADGISKQELLTLTACCEQDSTHPIAVSILAAAQEHGCTLHQPDDIHETAGHGISAKLDGAAILCGNASLMEQEHISLPSLPPAPGTTVVLAARNGKYLGRLLLSDTLKDGAAQTVSALKSRGITSAILTGDSPDSAAAIAQQAGIPEVHAQLLPQDKLSRLGDLRQKYGPVLFVGDGINDAPVLAGADVGAAMGSGADAAIEAADVVFLTSELDAIPESISIARAACRIAKQNVVFALTVKALVMILGLCGIASMWLAVFADTGVAMLCVLNSIRILYQK